ncbi:MAG: substrate-binding domain-containing protein [Eubacterium sp.]|nr:substrate-binding domain-containing protein [Eubacterium sp.]
MKLKKLIATGIIMAMAVSVVPVAAPKQTKAATTTITLSGSTSVSPLAQQLAKQYAKEVKGVKINFTNITGSGSGIADAMNGKVDIGMSSRALKQEEAAVLKANIICNDGIAIVVNKSNPVTNISAQQLYDLYAKKTVNWKTIQSSYNKPVAVYGRESGSGTRSCFEDVLKNDFSLNIAKNYGKLDAEISTTGAMQTSVKTNPGAIGYMSLGDLDATQVKAVKFNGVSATTENVANGTYKMSRPFVLATKGEATGATAAFINWIKTSSNAKKIISKMGFVNLSEVKIVPRKITLKIKNKITLKKGKTKKIKYTIYPANAVNKKVKFKSSNKKVATVSSKGVIKAKKKGKATITVTTVEGNVKAKIKVTVKKK